MKRDMVYIAARTLSDKVANECGVDASDEWMTSGEVWKEDAQEMLQACGAFDLLDALQRLVVIIEKQVASPLLSACAILLAKAREAIAKAIGTAP